MPLRVVFAEDNYLVREGTTALLATAPEVEVVASVSDSRDLLPTVAELSTRRWVSSCCPSTLTGHTPRSC